MPTHDPATSHPAFLADTISRIRPPDPDAYAAAQAHQDQLTKPPGSMGQLEQLGCRLAAIAGVSPPPVPAPCAVVVCAGDHGVHAQGVSPWPQEVTVQMVANVVAGGAVVNTLARQVGARVTCVDVGVAQPLLPVPVAEDVELVSHRVADGTADFTEGPAMTRDQVADALVVGIETATRLIDDGVRMLATGDLGIGNTTTSAALIAAMTGADPAAVTGAGAGSPPPMVQHKIAVIKAALERHQPSPRDPLGVLAAVGGLEHAVLVGLILGGASRRIPVLLDGVIAGSAALVARAFAPDAVGYLIAGHRSAEPGARVAHDELGLAPLIDLGLCLGEGSGAVLAVPLAQAAARMLREVATFESAGVSGSTTEHD